MAKKLTKRERSFIDKMHSDGYNTYIISRVLKRPEREIESVTSTLPDNSQALEAKERRIEEIMNAQRSSRKWAYRNPRNKEITRLNQLTDADQRALALEKQITGLQARYELISNKEKRLSLKMLKAINDS